MPRPITAPAVNRRALLGGLALYTELLRPAYLFYVWETAARMRRRANVCWRCLVGLLVKSLIARLYAIEMAWGSNGPLAPLGALLGIAPRHPRCAEVQVGIGLLHFTPPVVALMLVGTFPAVPIDIA